MRPIIPLKGAVQHYAWGGYTYIPQLLSLQNESEEPFAELWMGTHKNGTATVVLPDGEISLKDFIARSPEEVLGKPVSDRFGGQLPFLFKILDVRKMLSIQAHPNKASAEAGFRRENEQGVARDARNRNYKDDNHKPEVMVALTDFWLLHGFRSITEIRQVLQDVPAFAELSAIFGEGDIRKLYQHIMELPQEEVDRLLAPLKVMLEKQAAEGVLSKDSPHYWAHQAFLDYTRAGHYDRGIFSIYLFNLVFVPKGMGIFQDAGIPHAYLEGVNVELMANSDNVFRGGLTPKHIDVPELLKHLVFDPVEPQLLEGQATSAIERHFETPAPDFALCQWTFSEDDRHLSRDAEDTAFIYILVAGQIKIRSGRDEANFRKGDIFMIPAGHAFELAAMEHTELFGASAGRV